MPKVEPTRRGFVEIGLTLGALAMVSPFLQACSIVINQNNQDQPSGTVLKGQPTPGRLPTPSATAIAKAQRPNQENLISVLEKRGIRVELPNNPNWPTNYEAVAKLLQASTDKPVLTADHVTAVVDRGGVWRGWFMAEPAFPLKPNIAYKPELGCHVFTDTNEAVFDPQQIFETDWEKVKEGFSNRLIDLKINKPGIAIFARSGGVARDRLPTNTHYFAGTENVTIQSIEQLTLIPTSKEICPDDLTKAAATRSYRQAAVEFRDNPAAGKGEITVKWFHPEKGSFVTLDGRMIAKLKEQGNDLSILERLPAGAPLSPEDMAKIIGGLAGNWIVDLRAWEWFYEAFGKQGGINYIQGIGNVKNGRLLIGAKQADSRTSEVFDFSQLDTNALASQMFAPGSQPAVLFARAGMAPNNPALNNHSWYTWGTGNIRLNQKAIEQATFMYESLDNCPVGDEPTRLLNRAKILAQDQPDSNVTALYWNGSTFINAK